MAEGIVSGVVDAEGDGTEAAHDFAWVGPDGAAELVGVALVVVAAEDGVEVFRGGDVVGDVGVVVEGDAAAGEIEFREVTVEFDVRVFGGDAAEEEGVAVVVAEDGVDGAGEAGGEGGEGEGCAEVAEEAEVFSAFLLDSGEDSLEVGEVVVGVAEDGDFHVVVFCCGGDKAGTALLRVAGWEGAEGDLGVPGLVR